MVGLSHVGLRLLVRDYLPKGARTIWPTEMLNSRRLPIEKVGSTPETRRAPNETDLVPQILGNEEGPIAASVEKLFDWGASGIDINMGCPVNKALKHNYGVALMGDPDYAAEVVRSTVKHSRVPVSVKLRAAPQPGRGGESAASAPPDCNREFLLKFVRGLEDAGAAWICLHPRTAVQKRRGVADWSQIRMVREHLSIPVIGNGDVQTADDVFDMLEQTGCDLVMAGRALTARPWMLWQVGERLGWPPPPGRTGPAPITPEEEGAEFGRALRRLLSHHREFFSEDLGLRKFRFLVKTSAVWLFHGHDLYARVTNARSYDEMADTLAGFFAGEQSMSQRTNLRE
jgi:tRNA-dihydrouridine synthase